MREDLNQMRITLELGHEADLSDIPQSVLDRMEIEETEYTCVHIAISALGNFSEEDCPLLHEDIEFYHRQAISIINRMFEEVIQREQIDTDECEYDEDTVRRLLEDIDVSLGDADIE